MTKSEAAEALTKAGFPAEVTDNDLAGEIVMVKAPIGLKEKRELSKVLKQIHYDGSLGFTYINQEGTV